jgi:hypothetical protein
MFMIFQVFPFPFMFKKCFLLPLGLGIASALSAQSTTLLDDAFNSAPSSPVSINSSGDSTTLFGAQNLPTSARWFPNGATAASTEVYTNGGGLLQNLSASQSATAYFESSGSYQTLAVGDTLTMTVNFTLSNTTPPNNISGIRMALYNSGSTLSTSNQSTKSTGNTGTALPSMASMYSGYVTFLDPAQSAAAAATSPFSRPTGANSNFIASSTGFNALTVVNGPASFTNPGTDTYQATLTLNLASASLMNVTVDVTDLTTSTVLSAYHDATTASLIVSSFDAVTIGGNFTTTASPQTITHVTIVYSPPPAAAPTFSPVAGTYTAAQPVTLSSTTASPSFVYTTDGSTPKESGGVVKNGTLYSGPISVSTTTTLKAIAFATGSGDSPVSSATYTINIPVAAAPTFSPVASTYTAAQSVTLSSTTAGASFVYTTDGSPPTESGGAPTNGTLNTGTAISIPSTTTLKAIAFKSGFTDSSVTTGTYTINIPGQTSAPTFSPVAGTYTAAQSVTLSSTTAGASFVYTIDGTVPTESGGAPTNGTLNTGAAISIGSNTTLKAIAFKSGLTDSAVTSGIYTIAPLAVAPVFSPAAGSYVGAQSISISSTTAGASIAYTTDGSTPTESGGTVTHGTLYSGPVSVSTGTTLSAIAFGTGLTDSTVSTAAYTIIGTVAAPAFSPVAGTYTVGQLVPLLSATSGASIAYTTDGSTPTESGGSVTHGTLYSGTALMIGATTTIKAIGFKTGMADSAVSTAVYTINIIVLPNSNSGSGGALDTWFLGALAALGVLRWRRKRR